MHRSHTLRLGLLVLLVCASQAVPAEPAFVQHFGPEHQTLLVIPDPLPHIQALLTDARLRRVLLQGKLGDALRPEFGEPDPGLLLQKIKGADRWIPKEMAIGLSAGAMQTLDHIVRASLLVGLCNAATDIGDEVKIDLARLQDQLAGELGMLRLSGMTIWVQLRNAQDAATTLQNAQGAVAGLAGNPGITIQNRPSGISAHFDLAQMFNREQRLAALEMFGVITDENDPKAQVLSNAMGLIKFDVSLDRYEDGLLLRFGSPPAEQKALALADLGPLYRTDAKELMWARWDIRSLKSAATGWTRLWKAWEATPIGLHLREIDSSDMVGDLLLAERQMRSLAGTGTTRMWVDDGLHAQIEEKDVPAANSLTEVARFVPADAEAYWLDGSLSFGEMLSDTLSQFEDNMADLSLKAMVRGDEQREEQIDALQQAFYAKFAEFRDLVHQKSLRNFEGPTAVVMRSDGIVKLLDAQFELDGRVQVVRGQNLPIPQMAILARTTDSQQGITFMKDMYVALVKAIHAAAAAAPPEEKACIEQVDLGLGVPTWAPRGSWMASLPIPLRARINIDGDFRPHWFVNYGVLVFSTSPKLSRQLLDARAGAAKGQLKLDDQDRKVVAIAHVPGTTLAKMADHLAAWCRMAGQNLRDRQVPADEDPFERGVLILGALGDLARLIDRIESRSIDRDSVRTTDQHIRLVPAEAAK